MLFTGEYMIDPATGKPFDCIEYKRRVQREIYEKIKNMCPAEEIEYFRRQAETGPFAELLARIKTAKSGPVIPESPGDKIDTERPES